MANQATLVYEADSSQVLKAIGDLGKLNRASEQVAAGADKLSRAQEKQADSSRLLLGARRGVEALHRQEADTLRALTNEFNPLLAAQNRYTEAKARLSDAIQRNIVTEQQAQDQLQRLTAEFARAQVGAQNYADGMQRVNNIQGTAGNQFAQLNDVVVTAWGGMNPALIGMQQGMQVVQGFAGQSLPQALGTLKGAFGQLLSPTTLVTVAVIAGAAALIQWGAGALGAGANTKTFQESIDAAQASIDELRAVTDLYSAEGLTKLAEKYGVVNAEVLALVESQRILAQQNAITDVQAAIEVITSSLGEGLTNTPVWELGRAFETTSDRARGLLDVMEGIADLPTVERQLAVIGSLKSELSGVTNGFTDMNDEQVKMLNLLTEAEDKLLQLRAAAPSSSWMNAAISGLSALGESIRARIAEANRLRGLASQTDTGVYGEVGARGDPRRFIAGTSNTFDQENFTVSDISGGGSVGGGGGSGVNEAQTAWDALNQVQYQGVLTNLETLKWGLDQKLISEQEYNKRRAEMLTLEFGLESQQNVVKYSQELAALNSQFEQKLIAEEVYLQRRSQLQHSYYSGAIGVEQNAASQSLSQLSANFAQMNSLAGGGYDDLLRAQKSFAAGSALINAYLAASQALADPTVPFFGKLAAYAKVLAAGMGAVNAIKGGGGAGRGASAATGATGATRTEPTKNILINLTDINDRDATLIESIMTQIYERSRDGRVIIQRDR
jgi:hypothetical protein